ncbi:hypothetical protein [Schaalia sp. Marseille-Q2122]|uniref:hypothetical protein n=1 Tax=Schaalia sp. Marseille-Q2122 TaxID=2736604 RepID=UPI00158C0CB7|nr:hypothetical protein [Schaalia sp. Marseille-Q2122]
MTRTKRFLTALAALSLASALAACSPPPPEGMLADYPELPADYTGPTCSGTHTGPPTEGVIFGPFENQDPIPYEVKYNHYTEVAHDTKANTHGRANLTREALLESPVFADAVYVYYGVTPLGDPVIPESPEDFRQRYIEMAGDLNTVEVTNGGGEETIRYALPPRYIDGNLALGYTLITKYRVTGKRIEKWRVWRCDGLWTITLHSARLKRPADGSVPPFLEEDKKLLDTMKWVPKTRFEDPPPRDYR